MCICADENVGAEASSYVGTKSFASVLAMLAAGQRAGGSQQQASNGHLCVNGCVVRLSARTRRECTCTCVCESRILYARANSES